MHSISEIIAYAKEHGLLGLFKAGVRTFIFHRHQRVVTCLSLEEPLPEIQPLQNITIRKATLADVGELHQLVADHNWPRTRDELSEWIAKGYPFFVALGEDKIIGYVCISLGIPSGHPILDKAINSQDGDAWGADAFVMPAYRGKRIYAALASATCKCTAAAGYRRVFGTISSHNSSSRSAHQKIGCKEIKEITSCRVLFFRRTSIKSLREDILDE